MGARLGNLKNEIGKKAGKMLLQATIIGTEPMLMHSCKCVNPLHPITQKMAAITSKHKNQTIEDKAVLSDLEFEGGLYWDDEVGVYIPGENILTCLATGAKTFRKGSAIEKYVRVKESVIPLDYGARLTLEQLKENYDFRDVRPVVIGRARVIRTRPRFHKGWRAAFILEYDEKNIDTGSIMQALEYAGHFIGLGDYRPRYGLFEVTAEEVRAAS